MDETTIIVPLIRQHASDAAFYWHQISQSQFSVLQNSDDIAKFHEYLDANLDGLLISGNTGWNEAFKALKRWKTQGEAFVCSYIAHHTGNNDYVNACWDVVKRSPLTTVQGYISALTFLPYKAVQNYLISLQQSTDSLALRVLLGGVAAHQQRVSQSVIDACLRHEAAEVKVSVCHYIQTLQLKDYIPHLYTLNKDENLLVQHASAIALCWLDSAKVSVMNVLQDTIQSHLNAVPSKGLAGLLHHRRLEELIRIAGQVYSIQTVDISFFFDSLPAYLKMLFLGHAADTKHLPFLLDLLDDNELGQLAFWAVHMITGLDINESSYLMKVYEEDVDQEPIQKRSLQLSIGVGKPNSTAIRQACLGMPLPEGISILGQLISEQRCHEILKQGKQVERYIANWHLVRLNSRIDFMDIRNINRQESDSYDAFARK